MKLILLFLCFVPIASGLCPSGETATEYVTTTGQFHPPPKQLITQAECEELASQAGATFTVQNDNNGWYPNGCFTLSGNYRYGINGNDPCGANSKQCIIHNDVPTYQQSSGGMQLTEEECDTYAIEHELTYSENTAEYALTESECELISNGFASSSDATKPSGCYVDGGAAKWNSATTSVPCSTTYPCPRQQRKFLEKTSGAGDLSVTYDECNEYARTKGYIVDGQWDNTQNPAGCNIWAPAAGSTINRIKYNPSTETTVTCTPGYYSNVGVGCVVKERDLIVEVTGSATDVVGFQDGLTMEEECNGYAVSNSLTYASSTDNSYSFKQGCLRYNDNVYYESNAPAFNDYATINFRETSSYVDENIDAALCELLAGKLGYNWGGLFSGLEGMTTALHAAYPRKCIAIGIGTAANPEVYFNDGASTTHCSASHICLVYGDLREGVRVSGSTDANDKITEAECLSLTSTGAFKSPYIVQEYAGFPPGCIKVADEWVYSLQGVEYFYNTATDFTAVCQEVFQCVTKDALINNYRNALFEEVNTGDNDLSMSASECKLFADGHPDYTWHDLGSLTDGPNGCVVTTSGASIGQVYFNSNPSFTVACSSNYYTCIQKQDVLKVTEIDEDKLGGCTKSGTEVHYTPDGAECNAGCVTNINKNVKFQTSGSPGAVSQLTELQCKNYAGIKFSHVMSVTDKPTGCFREESTFYYNTGTSSTDCSATYSCLVDGCTECAAGSHSEDTTRLKMYGMPDNSMDASECQDYGVSIGEWGGVVDNAEISGCYIINDNNVSPKVYYNTRYTSQQCNLGARACIESWTQCDLCGQDEYQPSAGQTSCSTCGNGYVQLLAGQPVPEGATTCTECVAAIEWDHDGFAHTQCEATEDNCDAGFYFTLTDNLNPNTCTTCIYPTEYKVGTNTDSSCNPHPNCPVGEGRTNTLTTTEAVTCASCPAGQYSGSNDRTTCVTCPAGSVTNTLTNTGASTCTPCAAGKYSSSSTVACATCAAGSVTDTLANTGATTCTACPQTTYDHDGVTTTACDTCPAGSETNSLTGATTCTVCTGGEYSTISSNVCQSWDTCNPGEFKEGQSSSSNGQCTPCPAGYTCAGGSPYIYATSGAPVALDSAAYMTEAECKAFRDQFYPTFTFWTNAGTTTPRGCSFILAGSHVYHRDIHSFDCGQHGSTCVSKSAVACPAGNIAEIGVGNGAVTSGATTCTQCGFGTYDDDSDSSTTCDGCPAGSIRNNGVTTCTPCDAGSHSEVTTRLKQSGMPDNSMDAGECQSYATSIGQTFWSTPSPNESSGCTLNGGGVLYNTLNTAHDCTSFNGGVWCVEKWTECVSCGQDEYQPSAGQTSCATCGDGHVQLLAGTPVSEGATQCIICNNAHEYDHDGFAHTQCDATESTCDAGFYFTLTDNLNPNTCTTCIYPTEYKVGTNTDSSCNPHPNCPAGQGRTNALTTTEAVTCGACDSGTFSDVNNLDECQTHPTCPAGQGRTNALTTTEAVTCGACPAGQYSGSDSTDECITCPAGSVTNTLANTGATTCTACAAGTYSPNSQTACQACAAGNIAEIGVGTGVVSLGATTCTSCDPYHFSTVSTQACAQWTVCGIGEIKVGATTSSDGQCTACPAGEYVDSSCDICPYKTQCIVCPAGSITEIGVGTGTVTSGATTCTVCAAGEYDDDSDSSTACLACTAGTYDDDGISTTACIACAAGSVTEIGVGTGAVTSGATTCTVCAAGEYDDDSESSTACLKCPPDEASTSGQTSCTACDEHSAGATYVTVRDTGTGDFSMTYADCDTESKTDAFMNVSDVTKPSGCVIDTTGVADSYLYNHIKTGVACSNSYECVGHAAYDGSTECVTCDAGSWKNNDVCKRWSYRYQDDCTGGGAFVTGSLTQDSSCTPASYVYEELEPSDSSFDLSTNSVLCGDDYAILDQEGNIVCKPCDRNAFLYIYKGAITTSDDSLKRGSCCINSHHHVCVKMLEEFKRKCGTSFAKGQASCV